MGPFTVGQVPAVPQLFIVYDDAGNQRSLTSYTSIHANMISPSGVVTSPGTCALPDSVNNPGQVALTWPNVSPFLVAGVYQIQLEFVGPGAVDDKTQFQVFNVNPLAGVNSIPMWATPSDVAAITGQAVSDEQLVTAQMIIDLVSNRTPDVSGSVLKRDITWLKRAVAYQASWMVSQTDIFTRSSMANVSQDGVSGTYTSKAAIYLAPLAIRALKNVSWLRSRSLRIQSPFIDRGGTGVNPMTDDSLWNWAPMSMMQDQGGNTALWWLQ